MIIQWKEGRQARKPQSNGTGMFIRIFAAGFIVLMSGCVSTHSLNPAWSADLRKLGDGGVLTGIPCLAPCFLGITPGESTYADVVTMLTEHKLLGWCEIANQEIDCMKRDQYVSSLWFTLSGEQIVTLIGFMPDAPIEIGDIVGIYGNPSQVEVRTSTEFDYWKTQGSVYYQDLHIGLGLPQVSEPSYSITPKVAVESLIFCDSSSYGNNCNPVSLEHTVEWRGFGDYKDPTVGTQ